MQQYNQPPQYVTHRAQQELIKEFFQASQGGSQGQMPQQRNDCHRTLSSSNQQYAQAQFFQSQRVLSSDGGCGRGAATHHDGGGNQMMLIGPGQQVIEPQSAKIPASTGGGLNAGYMSNKNNKSSYVMSARGQQQQVGLRKSFQSNDKVNDESSIGDHGSFQQALGYLQTVCSKGQMVGEPMSARQQVHQIDGGASATLRPAQSQSSNQRPMSNYSNKQRQYESQNSRNKGAEPIGRVDSSQNNLNGPENNINNSYAGDNSSFQTGKDFADMVSIETANCLKQKQSSSSISRPQQQNYQTAYSKLSSKLFNGQPVPKTNNQTEIQTAIKDSKILTNFSNDQSDINCFEHEQFQKNVDKNVLSKSFNFSNKNGSNSSNLMRDTESSRVVPQMYMKQMCSGLNTSAVSQQQAIQNNRKTIQNYSKDSKNIEQASNSTNCQKYMKQQQPDGPYLKQHVPQKQAKSSERVQARQKGQANAYSPFQNRLYHQYQSSVPANQTYQGHGLIQQINSNNPNITDNSLLYQSTNNFNRTQELNNPSMSKSFKYPTASSLNIKSGNYSRECSRDSSQHAGKHLAYGKQNQQPSQSQLSKGNLHNPKVIRQDGNQNFKSSDSKQQLHGLMGSTGALAKSQGDRVVDSNNQTTIHNDSSNQESTTYATEKFRNKSATYMRNTDAYDNLDRNFLLAGSDTNVNTMYNRESSKSPNHQNGHAQGFDSFGFNAFYNHLKESQNSRTIQQNGFSYPELSQTIDQNEVHNSRKMLDNRIYQSLASKSACTTARGHGPTVASGPLNPLGNKQVTANQQEMRTSNSNQRPSQLRQSACGLAPKVTKTASRKSLGFQSNLNSLANSKKQLEPTKTASLRGGNVTVGTIEEKNGSFTRGQGQKGQKMAGLNARNSAVNSKSPLIQTNINNFGTQRSKQFNYSGNQNEQAYPRVSPKSTSSLNKNGTVDLKYKKQVGSSAGGAGTTASQMRARHTPTKTDQTRKSNVSPFKTTPNQAHGNKIDGYAINDQDSGTKQTSPEQSSIIAADLKYLYERQKKMVAQLSQNKIGSSIQKQVPGLTLETINERMHVTGTGASPGGSGWNQSAKHQQTYFTPSAGGQGGIHTAQMSKTMRGAPPSSYQSFIQNAGQVRQKEGNAYSNIYEQQKQNQNKQQTYTSLLASKILGISETRQGQQVNVRQSQGGGGTSAVATHRDFIQENKKVCSQAFDKMQTIQVGQNRGAQSQGKTTQTKPQSKDKTNRTELRMSHNTNTVNDKVTPKKLVDKNHLAVQKQKTRNDMNKTQYLSKKSNGTTQSKKQIVNYNNVIGSMVKSPSYRGMMATQIVESTSKQNLIDNLLNNKSTKPQKTFIDQQNKMNQQFVKTKQKVANGLNMTINISSSNRQEANSVANTYRATNKSQQRYIQTQPEDPNDSKLNLKSQTMKGQDISDYLRTVQTSQGQNDNNEIMTFANNQANQMNFGVPEVKIPTFQQQLTSANRPNSHRSSEKQTNNGQIQISECSREQILLQKPCPQQVLSNSSYRPTAQNSNEYQKEVPQKKSVRRDEIANILIQSKQSKNHPASTSSKGTINNSKVCQKNSNSSPSKKNETIINPGEHTNNNVVSFQQIQEKSVKSQETRSPGKKQKEDKENLQMVVRPVEQNPPQAQVFYSENSNKHQRIQNQPKKPDIGAIETQNEETENKCNDYKATNKTNVQSNIQQYLQAQKQERPVFAPQSQNQVQKPDTALGQLAVAQQQTQAQPAQQNNTNDTMCFSQKMSLDEYVIGKQIGQGAYAVVRIGLHKPTNKKVAMKIYKKYKLEEPNRRKSVKREIKLMEKMKHESIVQLFEIIDTQKYVILIMEYVGGGSLHGYLKSKSKRRLEEWDAKRIFKQIIEGLKYCHSRCITHRDIKLENLLLDENSKIKIIDFGFSTCIPNDKKIKIFCGTPSYMAPEIVMKTEYCGPPADIWAMGVLLFTILSGQFPYRGATDEELYDKICRADYHLPKEVKDSLSPAAKDLIAKLFSLNADDRPTARQILEHQWLYNVDRKEQQNADNHHDSITQIQSTECLQIQKRAKSQRLDCVNAPKNKTSETAAPIERRIAVNPFNILNHGNEQQNAQEAKRSLNKIGQQAARSSSHNPGKAIQNINGKVIQLISAKLGYDVTDVENQVRKDLLLSETKDKSSSYKTNNQLSFIGNLYLRILDEEEEQKNQLRACNQHRAKSDNSTSEQQNIYHGSDAKSQQKSENGYHSSNLFNQTQHFLMKSAISQTSLGMSGTGGNMTSQGFGQGTGLQNLAIQPSYVPSMKSLNSGSGGVNLGNTASLTHLNFNNTLTTPINFNNTVHNGQAHSPLNFNNTQPLKGILDTLNDTTTTYSAAQPPQILSTPSTHRDQQAPAQHLPLNFTQTNIFVTNNNQVYGSGVSSSQQTEKRMMEGCHQRTASGGTTQDDNNTEPHFSVVMPQSSRTVQAQKRMSKITSGNRERQAMLVNNFFTEAAKNESQKIVEEQQESPNFRQRGAGNTHEDNEGTYCSQA